MDSNTKEYNRMTNATKTYHRKELAKQQLSTAIWLFLTEKDFSSSITLSAAASNLMTQLALNSGEKPFIDYACLVKDAFTGKTPSRDSHRHLMHNMLGINVHKHMDQKSPLTIDLDLQLCAELSITAAIADYVKLYGQDEAFIKYFLHWKWSRQDGKEMIEAYDRMPGKLKNKEIMPTEEEFEKLKTKVGIKKREGEVKTYQQFQLAESQLISSIGLFTSDRDKISAITLAGAADVIFCELVKRENKKSFTEILQDREVEKRKLKIIGKEINDLLRINQLKHLDNGEDENIEIDVDECGVAAILKALVNYSQLESRNVKLVNGFRYWVKTNLDPIKYNLVETLADC